MRAFFRCLFFVLATASTVQADPPHPPATATANRLEEGTLKGNSVSPNQDTVDGVVSSSSIAGSSLALLDGEILFGLGDFELTQKGRDSLQQLIQKLSQFDAILSIRIIGHTDNAGDASYNLYLSKRRADWIKEYFSQAYPDTHMMTMGAGESAPLVSNSTAPGRKRNRRVAVQVIATGKAPIDR